MKYLELKKTIHRVLNFVSLFVHINFANNRVIFKEIPNKSEMKVCLLYYVEKNKIFQQILTGMSI